MPGTIGNSGGGRLRGDHDPTEYDGGPVKPLDLSDSVSKRWDVLLEQLPKEALRQVDVYNIRQAAVFSVLLESIEKQLEEKPSDKDLRCAYTQYSEKFIKLSGHLGMSPADRKRIQIAQPKEKEDDLSEFSKGT